MNIEYINNGRNAGLHPTSEQSCDDYVNIKCQETTQVAVITISYNYQGEHRGHII